MNKVRIIKISQGNIFIEKGPNFSSDLVYIIRKGNVALLAPYCEIEISGYYYRKDFLATRKDGDLVNHLQAVYDLPKFNHCFTLTDCQFFVFTQQDFKDIFTKKVKKETKKIFWDLKNLSMFREVEFNEILCLMSFIDPPKWYEKGRILCNYREEFGTCFIVLEGKVVLKIKDDKSKDKCNFFFFLKISEKNFQGKIAMKKWLDISKGRFKIQMRRSYTL